MAADPEGVQRLLVELHRVKDEGFPDSEINDPASLVEQLSQAVMAVDPHSPGEEAEVALFSSFMFQSRTPPDLLSFVTDTVNKAPQGTKKARMAALRAVEDFLKHVKGTSNVGRYASRIKDGVWDAFNKETESQEVRSHALRPLRQLLKLRPPALAAEKWEVIAMWEAVKEQFRMGPSKTSQGVRGELLKLAGVLILVYGGVVPELAEGGVDTALGWCDHCLEEHSRRKKMNKRLEPQVVAGAFACIDLICSAGFEARYTVGASSQERNKSLYMHLLTAVAEGTAPDVSRYEVSAKALRFFRRHASLFSDNVGPGARALQLYEFMEKCVSGGGASTRQTLKKHALAAIEAVLRVTARYASSSDDATLHRKTVVKFEGMWLSLLERGDPDKEEIAVALTGLAALSPAAAALYSYHEAADITDRLLVCLNSTLSRLDAVGFGEGDTEVEIASGRAGVGDGYTGFGGARVGGTHNASDPSHPSYNGYVKRDRSLRLEAQFLRTLACRAGVMGAVAARGRMKGQSSKGTSEVVAAAVPGHVLRRLETIAVRLMEQYPRMSHKDRELACHGLCQLWVALSGPGQGDNLSRAMAAVVPKGVVRATAMEDVGYGGVRGGDPRHNGEEVQSRGASFAGVQWVAPVDPLTGEADTRLCFMYAEMWRRVLDPQKDYLETLVALPEGLCRRYAENIAPVVYDCVLSSVLAVVKRLDLRYETSEESGRPYPLQATDQQLFINLVTFCQELLPACRPDLLLEWTPLLCPELVERCLERPLVSGFYRLITLVFRVTARARYFDMSPSPGEGSPLVDSERPTGFVSGPALVEALGAGEDIPEVGKVGKRTAEAVMGREQPGRGIKGDSDEEIGRVETIEGGSDGGVPVCRRVLRRYLEWVTARLGGFRDELQTACVETLLSAPLGLLDGDLGPLVPALKVALSSGSTHLPPAVVAVSALERWHEECPAFLSPHLENILPQLDQHLSSDASASAEGRGSGEKARRSKGAKASSSGPTAAGAVDQVEESRRKELRRRIVRFLGRLGGMNHLVAADASQALSNSLAWDTKPRIVLQVPFKDQVDPLPLGMDGILQRLVELAKHDSTRQTKTLAVECLHALVVYMVGCTATDPSSGRRGKPGDFSKLFRRVFPSVLRLAVDLEETTRTLFSKLALQLVRWFSQARTDNDDTVALLDCLGDGAATEEGGPLREFCAKGIVEFLRYAIKQSSKRQQAEGPVAVDALLTRVFSLMTHPDKNRRLGGLMAFNQLCRPLREETALVDRYGLRLLHVAMVSLRRAYHDHSALAIADAASAAVDRSLRMVHHSIAELGDRADLLRRKDSRGAIGNLREMVEWTWEKVGAVETRFRRKCMTLLLALCPLLVATRGLPPPPPEEGTRRWLWKRLAEVGGESEGISDVVRVFENASGASPSTTTFVGDELGGSFGGKGGCEAVATAADCYKFACETGIITPDELFLGDWVKAVAAAAGLESRGDGARHIVPKGKKRKASESAPDSPGDGSRNAPGEGSGTGTPSPRILRSIRLVADRYGKYLGHFPFEAIASAKPDGMKRRHPTARDGPGHGDPEDSFPKMVWGVPFGGHVSDRPTPLDDPASLPTELAAARLARAVFLRRCFNLMAVCLSSSSRPEDMAATLVKEGLWSPGMHCLVVYSLVWPWAGGLLPRASDGDEVEIFLPAAVERLLRHWRILDLAAGKGSGLCDTLAGLLRLRMPKARDDAGDSKGVDLCLWILSGMFSSTKTRSRPPLRDTPEIGSSTGRRAVSGSDRLPSSTLPVSEPSGRVSRSNEGDREALVGSVQGVHDDELASRVIRAYRTFARVGLLGEASCGGPMAAVTERLVGGLWSTVLGLPEGLRPVLTQKAGTALRLAIELGLPIVSSSLSRSEVLSASRNATTGAADALYLEEGSGWEFNNREGECILRGLIDISSAQRRPEVARDAVVVAGAPGGITKGALFYRRFSDIIHDALLRTGGGGCRGSRSGSRVKRFSPFFEPSSVRSPICILRSVPCPWPGVCRLLVESCLSGGDMMASRSRDAPPPTSPSGALATQAFNVLEGVLDLQLQRVAGSARYGMVSPRQTFEDFVPHFRRLIAAPAWGPPLPEGEKGGGGGDGCAAMLRESLRLCHRLLRLSAAVDVGNPDTTLKGVSESQRQKRKQEAGPQGDVGPRPASGSRSRSQELLEMSSRLVAGTLGSASPSVDVAAKAEALALVPYFCPCLTVRALYYGQREPGVLPGSAKGDSGDSSKGGVPRAEESESDTGSGGVGRSQGRERFSSVVLPAVEEMMSRHFPIDDSREPAEGSPEATAFALLLRGLLGVLVRSGDMRVLELLFSSLAEGREHLYRKWIVRALDELVSGLDVEADGVAETVFGFCLDTISSSRVAVKAKAAVFDKVCLPTLRRCPVDVFGALYLSKTVGSGFRAKGLEADVPVVRRLSAVVEKRGKETGKFAEGSFLTACCFGLIEALYEMLSLDELKALAKAAMGQDGSLTDLTKTVVKPWKALRDGARVSMESKGDSAARPGDNQSWLELRTRRAAFSCVCTVVRSTQVQEKHFDVLVWADPLYDASSGRGEKNSVLSLLLDLSQEHHFEVNPPYFHVAPLRPPRLPLPGCTARKLGPRPLTASGMLSQSSLAFGGLAGVESGERVLPGHGAQSRSANRSGGDPTEDSREDYSSQVALAEPPGVPVATAAPTSAAGLQGVPDAKKVPSQTSDESGSYGSSASQRESGSVMLAGSSKRGTPAWRRGVKGAGEAGEEHGVGAQAAGADGGLKIETSHVNREPCMRSLLLVLDVERKLFEMDWLDRAGQSRFEPAWSTKMRAKLADPCIPRNVRLLAFQFALNAPATGALSPWAEPWIVVMTDFALSPLPEGIRQDGERGLHYMLRDFAHVLLDESPSGWGSVVREGRQRERRNAHGGDTGVAAHQPLLAVGNRLVSHLMSVASCPAGKRPMLRANMELIAGLVSLFGEDAADDGDAGAATQDAMDIDAGLAPRANDLRLDLGCVVEMLELKEGYTGGAHASTESKGVRAKHSILTGLNLLGIMFEMRVPVLVASNASADELARILPVACLSYNQKNVFDTGTELLAMALKHVAWLKGAKELLPREDELCAQCQAEGGEWFTLKVTERLSRLGREPSSVAQNRYLHAVSTLANFYPQIVTRKLLLSAIAALPRGDAVYRGQLLSTLADAFPRGHVPVLEEPMDLMTRLQPFLPSLLLESEVEFVRGAKEAGGASEWIPLAQLSALRLVRALTPTLKRQQLELLLGEDDAHSLVGLATPSTFRACREVAYATLLDLHNAARGAEPAPLDDGGRGGASLSFAQRETVRFALLRGLSDPDDEGMTFKEQASGGNSREMTSTRRGIRRRLLDVFDAPAVESGAGGGLNEAPGQRLLSLMRDMFDSRTAKAWLRFAPYLLLRPAEQAPGYNALLFKSSLMDCQFVDMSISAGVGGLNARPMEPTFSFASLSSQGNDGAPNVSVIGGVDSYGTLTTDVAERKAGMVRATQEYLWSQTQVGGRGIHDIGSTQRGGRQAAGSGRGAANSSRQRRALFPSQTQSKLLAPRASGPFHAAMGPPAPRAPGAGAKDGRSRGGGNGSQGVGGVGRRFWQNSSGNVSNLGPGETHGMHRRIAAKREREKAARARKAVIYRNYRDGELPDIQIKLGDVLRPLQHLSMLDGGIAKEVFVQIFKSVFASLPGGTGAPSSTHVEGSKGTGRSTSPDPDYGEGKAPSARAGRAAVGTLLQRMLAAAKHDTDVVACLHAACRAAASAPPSTDLAAADGVEDRGTPAPESKRRGQNRPRALVSTAGTARGARARGTGTGKPAEVGGDTGDDGTEDVRSSGATDAIELSPGLVADTALASLNIHSGILLLEDRITRSSRDRAACDAASVPTARALSIGRRRSRSKSTSDSQAFALERAPGEGVTDFGDASHQDSWLELSRLYAALGERDVLVGVSARASRLDDTRRALEEEFSGDFAAALRLYAYLQRRFETRFAKDSESPFDHVHEEAGILAGGDDDPVESGKGKPEASVAELVAWDMRQLECMHQLGQWKDLRTSVKAMASEDGEGEDTDGEEDEEGRGPEGRARVAAERQRRVWNADPGRRDDVLPYLVWSIVHDEDRDNAELKAFLEAATDPEAPQLRVIGDSDRTSTYSSSSSSSAPSTGSSCTRLEWLETNMPGELAKAFMLGGQLGRAHQCVARCYDRFQEKWAGLHPCADAARREQLRGLQLVVEVEDFLSFSDGKGETVAAASINAGRVEGEGRARSGNDPPWQGSKAPHSRLHRLLGRWSRQTPSSALDPVTSWAAILAHRRDSFRAIEGLLAKEGLSKQDMISCRRAMLRHRGELSLSAAGAAIAQGVLDVAENLMLSYANIKKKFQRLARGDGMKGCDGEALDIALGLTTTEFNWTQLERLRLKGNRSASGIAAQRAEIIADALTLLDGCASEQKKAMRMAMEQRRVSPAVPSATSGGRSLVDDEWESSAFSTHETRLRLLTLQGQWLEAEGLLLAEKEKQTVGVENTPTDRIAGRTAVESFSGAFARLEEASEIGDRIIPSPPRNAFAGGATDGANAISATAERLGGSLEIGRGTASRGALSAASEAMLRLAKLCDGLASDGGPLSPEERVAGRSQHGLATLAVKQYLRAMSAGSAAARDRFPRVLHLMGRFPRAREAFLTGSSSVPEWAFLRWVSQMLALTGRREGPVVVEVLERIARVYPRALFYPLNITKASAARTDKAAVARVPGGETHDDVLAKLKALTFDPTLEAFAEALAGLDHPENRFMDAMKRIMELLGKKQLDLARQAYVKMRADCLVIEGRKIGDKMGRYNRDFAKARLDKMDAQFGRDGRLLDASKAKKAYADGTRCKQSLLQRVRAASGSREPLSLYSTWMSDFDYSAHTLEIPGQYGGMLHGPPRVSHHSRVVSFGSEILLMKSLRLPKRLVMHANDEGDYMFLVKGGEDLRLDERVEQLFEVMNAVMARSAACRHARLTNKTYKVIPVTPEIGMIEWVRDTRPLRGVIEEGLGQKLNYLPAQATFIKWLGGSGRDDNFHRMFKTMPREKVEDKFAECCSSVPTDALRRHLLSMAPGPEAFLTCRGGFARSLATLNACSYVLGIGDRHLDNFLLDTTSGAVIGIDFGAAFGHGSSVLPVPELIPFRLTNQFQNLLQPLDSVGLLKGHMISTLQALRTGGEVLLATMDVFLNEPVIDWLEGAAERQKAKKEDEDGSDAPPSSGSEESLPQPRPPPETGRKIRNARRKLEGDNPAAVMIDDLAQNPRVVKHGSLEKLKNIVWGDSGHRVRSRAEHRSGTLSVADQVECLIDLATDPDILGRQWIGLATWV